METFIVRIYRRVRHSAGELAGTVEAVGSGQRTGFSGGEQLLDRLLRAEAHSGSRGSTRSPSLAGGSAQSGLPRPRRHAPSGGA